MKKLASIKVTSLLFLLISLAISLNTTSFSQENTKTDFVKLPFINEGSLISGIFFKAENETSAPTAILVQGFPGRDGDIKGIGGFLKREGINAFVFNYRGSWKSEGLFSVDNAVSDVIKAVGFLSTREIAEKYNIDTKKNSYNRLQLGSGNHFPGCRIMPVRTKDYFYWYNRSKVNNRQY